ncbi:hypothetical protein J2T41_000678 [Pseudomonas citronellolis]|uniref:DUF2931 family protein n=1 Tax=Pseudomonas citronellolis TaxID=53408 RepID=UPI00209F7B92|nr:DUF2931 family protein [Pseudomonas citronellolis]MCP1641082.1 hypothetical protein [Pseudomonas citronellolis]MCP1664000.1 hypothetical protein [Pseudomonas citronellolis]MCP1700669.1 hypothetical protein [Pseudomonas citronellolis]MCP1707022.1 hypothetical protein [Pseudomonas citronellolis]MCP1800805.1 hypothetical protein [Pseudomonas citronellolis]
MKSFVLMLCLALLGGCAQADKGTGDLPYRYWRLGFLAPDYMEVWVETADVEDTRGRFFPHMGGGIVAVSTPENLEGNAKGWGPRVGWGGGRYVDGADLPKRIFVRWQSLAEPQTYRVILDIPERARQLMVEKLDPPCKTMQYRQALAIGLAPGGVVRGWVRSTCGESIEILQAQAEVEPKGPSQGKTDGKYALPLEPASKAYIEKHGIPYGSW